MKKDCLSCFYLCYNPKDKGSIVDRSKSCTHKKQNLDKLFVMVNKKVGIKTIVNGCKSWKKKQV